ncbi:MAG: signal peptidase II [Sphingobacteriales bacterium]
MKKYSLPLIVIFAVVVLDQALKIWIKTNMFLGEEIPLFGNWFLLHFTENNGMAFGFEFAGEYGKLFLTLFRILAVTGIGYYLFKLISKNAPKGLQISLSLVFSGAIGNIIDSTFYGKLFGYETWLHGRVVDMFYAPLFSGTFPQWLPFWAGESFLFFRPVFNLADAAITVGVAMILVFQRNFFEIE